MRRNYFCIYCVFIGFLAFQSVFGQNESTHEINENVSAELTDQRAVNLKKQAIELFAAYDTGNVDEFVQLSHPNIYKKMGREKFSDQARESITLHMELDKPLPSIVENPGEIVEFNKQLFCVFPYKLERTKEVNKNKTTMLGSMVAISDNNGETWKFVKGLAFNEAFPDVAGMIIIPNPVEKKFVNDVEQ